MLRVAVLQEIEESRQDETDSINYKNTVKHDSSRGAWRRNTIGTVIEKRQSKQARPENLEQKEHAQSYRPYV